jgi:cytochrome c biogenesis protein CcdA
MIRLIGVVLSVGLADSINPTTVGPALYFAAARGGAARVIQFTIGVFAVNFAGGLLLLGPGKLLIGLVSHPQHTARHVIESVAGAVLLTFSAMLWLRRRALAEREFSMRGRGRGSALLAGVSIAAVELPTAAPYFAVIAAIAASNANFLQEIALVALFNLAFVLPLIGIAGVLVVAKDRAEPLLEKARAWVQRRWPVVLAAVLLLAGSALIVLGVRGLIRHR